MFSAHGQQTVAEVGPGEGLPPPPSHSGRGHCPVAPHFNTPSSRREKVEQLHESLRLLIRPLLAHFSFKSQPTPSVWVERGEERERERERGPGELGGGG